ncbi:hypothetical protein MKEN_00124100 [Mycena kentingensis (nom. inval.)]|nr:hypothetical protein MKEN_00124100 [Mycena kentingensis (nom. inval.)]
MPPPPQAEAQAPISIDDAHTTNYTNAANASVPTNSSSSSNATAMDSASPYHAKVLANPLDNGIQPHVPHWIIVILCLILVGVILTTVITAARTGGHIITKGKDGKDKNKKLKRRHSGAGSMFRDLKAIWPRASIDSMSSNGWSQPLNGHAQAYRDRYGKPGSEEYEDRYTAPPPRYSLSEAAARRAQASVAPDVDDALSRLTQANTFKNQRRVAAAVAHASGIQYEEDEPRYFGRDYEKREQEKEGRDGGEIPPILRPAGARW